MQPNTLLCWGGMCGSPIPNASPSPHPITLQSLQPIQAPRRDQAQLEKEDGRCWPLLGTGSSGQGRSVPRCHCGQGRPPRLDAGGRNAGTHQLSSPLSQLAVVLSFHSQHMAVWGGRRGVFIFIYWQGRKRNPLSPPVPCNRDGSHAPSSLSPGR